MTLRKILVLVDFSDASSAALDHAVKVVSLAGTHPVLLHMLELPRSQINPEIFDALQGSHAALEHRRRAALARLEPPCREFRTLRVECMARVRAGVPHEEMLREAEQMGPDLIIVVHKGGGIFSRFLLGSSAERGVRHAACTIVVARHLPDEQALTV